MQDKDTGACGASAPRLHGMQSSMRVGDISRSAQERVANAWGTWDNLFTEYHGKDDDGNTIKQTRLRYPPGRTNGNRISVAVNALYKLTHSNSRFTTETRKHAEDHIGRVMLIKAQDVPTHSAYAGR